ncbi:putative pterin-binding protein [Roseixanthobacter pseudopolyaromaticivorans]|uniref:hypothetical protein n=1 Tax=Xanthobacteraceae TaxID=335928 RepID=UPI00372AF538
MKTFRAHVVLLLCALVGLDDASAAQTLSLSWRTSGGSLVAERQVAVAELEAFPPFHIDTTTPWTRGRQAFDGPSLLDLSRLFPGEIKEARVEALNDYSAAIPAEDMTYSGPILATRRNKLSMPVRDKGPFWIIYPMDAEPRFNSATFRERMVWQVKSIEFIVR